MTTEPYDLVDDPIYEGNGLSVSTDTPLGKRASRDARWGVYYHGRLLHGGLSSSSEAAVARGMYAEGLPASDYRWQLLTNKGKKPSPSTDHRRKAGVEPEGR